MSVMRKNGTIQDTIEAEANERLFTIYGIRKKLHDGRHSLRHDCRRGIPEIMMPVVGVAFRYYYYITTLPLVEPRSFVSLHVLKHDLYLQGQAKEGKEVGWEDAGHNAGNIGDNVEDGGQGVDGGAKGRQDIGS